MRLSIVADPNIAAVAEAFADLGDIRLVPGRGWTPHVVRDADLLLVRSVTRVDENLLRDSRLRFVGTATSGVDHIDQTYLASRHIAFAACPGSNAQAVAEYVLSAILVLCDTRARSLPRTTAGIIGYGQVGSRVARLLSALGMRCLLHDPPLADRSGDPRYCPLDEILTADIVTLHVPWTDEGPYPTRGLIGQHALARMKPDAILINTARGGIVDEQALKERLARHASMAAVIDCWEGEPDIDPELARRSSLATPHIAGYSSDAKLRATGMLYAAACAHFAIPRHWSPSAPAAREIAALSQDPETARREVVLSVYDIREDDRALRACLTGSREALGRAFDALRANYRERREFSAHEVHFGPAWAALADLGFRIRGTPPSHAAGIPR